jgi:hypothetical protein
MSHDRLDKFVQLIRVKDLVPAGREKGLEVLLPPCAIDNQDELLDPDPALELL